MCYNTLMEGAGGMKKRILFSALAMLLILLLSGCAAKTIDEMYALPRRSERNNNLRSAIESAMEGREARKIWRSI